MIYESSGLEKSLLSYSPSKSIKIGLKMLTQQFFSIFGVTISATIDAINVVPCSFLDQFMSFFHELLPFFECKRIIFLNFPLWWDTLVFEAAILAYKQKVTMFQMPPNQFLALMRKTSLLYQNSKP